MIIVKNSEQIEGIRESCKILVSLFEYIEKFIEPGITTQYLDTIAYQFICDHKSEPAFLGYGGFPNSLCTSVNSEVIHGIPNRLALENGDIVSIDCGVIYNGYYSDYAYTYKVGEVSPEIEALLTITEESLYKGIEAMRVGNRIRDISNAIYNHTQGYGVVREFSGHGVGIELHEEPSIPNYPQGYSSPRIRSGYVLAIEPMINLGGDEVFIHNDEWTVETRDRSISAHFEHTVLAGESGPEILTLRQSTRNTVELHLLKQETRS